MNNIIFANDTRMKDFAESMKSFTLPRWHQISNLGLYMDQVVTIIENELMPLLDFEKESFITSSMINNYVKLGVMSKPEKKKYFREQIACLIVITMLKQSYSISDVRYGINISLNNLDPQTAYDRFCDYFEYSIRTVAENVMSSNDSLSINFGFSGNDAIIAMAAGSFAVKVFSLKMLEIIREDDIPIADN